MTFRIPIIILLAILNLNHNIQVCSAHSYDCESVNRSIFINQEYLYSFLSINNFNKLSEIKINCFHYFSNFNAISIIPNSQIILDDSLNLTGLFLDFDPLTIKFIFYFANFKGINLNFKANSGIVLTFFSKEERKFSLRMRFSKFAFYNNRNQLLKPNSTECSQYRYEYGQNFFFEIRELYVAYSIFSTKICPMWFVNSKLQFVTLNTISNSLISKNKLEFIELDEKDAISLITPIKKITIEISYEYLTTSVLNRHLFRNIVQFNVFGNNIYDIEYDLFKHFSRLTQILFFIDNFKQFYHSNKNKWMYGLAYSSATFNIDKPGVGYEPKMYLFFTEKTNDFKFYEAYQYPEEDFCLFSHFPHEKLIYPVFDGANKINCSCTILWLIKYTNIYADARKINHRGNDISFESNFNITVDTLDCLLENNLNDLMKKCNFNQQKKLCNNTSLSLNETNLQSNNFFSFQTDEDVLNFIQLTEYVLIIVLNPIFAFFGMLTNLMVVLVIYNFKNFTSDKRNKMKKSNHSMFKHILIHSFFNFFYCFIISFKPLNECLIFTSSLFCSPVYTDRSAQYFKIIFTEFLGNMTKTCSNISYVAITFSRLLIMPKKSKSCLNKFENLKLKYYFLILVVFSSLLSGFKFFQFNIDHFEDVIYSRQFPSEQSNKRYCISNKNTIFECEILGIIKVVNSVINDIFFFIVTVILDIIVLSGLSKMIKSKKEIVDNFHEIEENKKKKRIQKMVFINGLVFVFSHLPELIVSVYLLNQSQLSICEISNCDKLSELAQFFIFFSMLSQFFINKNYNSIFLESYNQIISNIEAKLKKKYNRNNAT